MTGAVLGQPLGPTPTTPKVGGDDVVTAALAGLRQAFKLDALLVAVPEPSGDLRTWVDHRDDLDKELDNQLDSGLDNGLDSDLHNGLDKELDKEAPEFTIARSELAKLLKADRPGARWGYYRWLRGRYLWLRGPSGEPATRASVDNFGIAAARRTRLSPVESTILSDLCRAIVRFQGLAPHPALDRSEMVAKTRVAVRPEGGGIVAEVQATWALPTATDAVSWAPPPRRVGLGRASDPVLAVARGAAKASRPRCEIVHVGVVQEDVSSVGVDARSPRRSFALIRTGTGDLRMGLAACPAEVESAPLVAVALAVLTASLPEYCAGNEIDLTPAQMGQKLR